MQERARLRAQGVATLPHVPDGAVPSIQAAMAAIEKFQADCAASVGSVSTPLARAQEQLAALEASLEKQNAPTPFYETEAYKQGLQACMKKYSDGAKADIFSDQGGNLLFDGLIYACMFDTKLPCLVSC